MFLILLSLFAGLNFSFAQDLDPYDFSGTSVNVGNADQDQADYQQEELDIYQQSQPQGGQQGSFKNTGFVFFPFYTKVDEENSAYGLDTMYYFRRQKEPPLSKPSYLRGVISAGSDSYASIDAAYNSYWKSEFNHFYSSVGFERRRANYYQPLIENPLLLGEFISSQTVLEVMYRQRFSTLSYMGIKFEFQNSELYSKNPATSFNSRSNSVYGLDGGHVSGLGFVWSSLEPGGVFSSLRGFDFDTSNTFYLNYFGSNFNFGIHKVDIRENVFITGAQVLLLKFYGRFITGDPPYSSLSTVGEMFRAYSIDKYRDRHFMGMNAEYRILFISDITIRGFFGLGYHSSSFSKFKLNNDLPCYGAGLSFVLNKELGINAGLEYLAGKDSKGFLFGIGDNY